MSRCPATASPANKPLRGGSRGPEAGGRGIPSPFIKIYERGRDTPHPDLLPGASAELLQLLSVMAQVVRHESLYEVVPVIVARLNAQVHRLTGLGRSRGEFLRHQLFDEEWIGRALIDENGAGKRLARDQLAGGVFPPSLSIRPEIVGERFLAPRTLHRCRDRRERGNRFVPVRVAQRANQRAVTSHGMAEDSGCAGLGGKMGGDQLRQLPRDITVHPIVLRPRRGGGIDVEPGRVAEIPAVSV